MWDWHARARVHVGTTQERSAQGVRVLEREPPKERECGAHQVFYVRTRNLFFWTAAASGMHSRRSPDVSPSHSRASWRAVSVGVVSCQAAGMVCAPNGGEPKISRFFFPSRSHFRSFSLSGGLLVEFWWCLKRLDPQMCTFGVSGCRANPPATKIGRAKTKLPQNGLAQIGLAQIGQIRTVVSMFADAHDAGLRAVEGGFRAGSRRVPGGYRTSRFMVENVMALIKQLFLTRIDRKSRLPQR